MRFGRQDVQHEKSRGARSNVILLPASTQKHGINFTKRSEQLHIKLSCCHNAARIARLVVQRDPHGQWGELSIA